MKFLRDKARRELGDDVVLFTTDGDGDGYLKCGTLPDVYATVDFGVTCRPIIIYKHINVKCNKFLIFFKFLKSLCLKRVNAVFMLVTCTFKL